MWMLTATRQNMIWPSAYSDIICELGISQMKSSGIYLGIPPLFIPSPANLLFKGSEVLYLKGHPSIHLVASCIKWLHGLRHEISLPTDIVVVGSNRTQGMNVCLR
jgi:hypothetical protein